LTNKKKLHGEDITIGSGKLRRQVYQTKAEEKEKKVNRRMQDIEREM
jgi:hypothetical protein